MEKAPTYNGKPTPAEEWVILDGPGSHPVYGEPKEELSPCPNPSVEEAREPTLEQSQEP